MIKLVELFGGIGTQAMAMRALKKEFSTIGYVEWNEESVACYRALAKKSIDNGTEKALEMLIKDDANQDSLNFDDAESHYHKAIRSQSITDVTAADFPILHNGKDIFIMFSSFPCQSLSKESSKGREGGGIDPTRRETEPTAEELKSALVWDTIRIFKELHDADPDSKVCLPHYIFMENVIGMIDVENRAATLQILRTLNDIGYDTELMVIDGNKIGEPQMRKRVFVVSKLRGVGLPEYIIPSVATPVTDYDKALGNIMRAPSMTEDECESLKKTLMSYIDPSKENITPDSIYAAFDPNNFIASLKKTLSAEDGKPLPDYRNGLESTDSLTWNNTRYGIGNTNVPTSRTVKMTAEKRGHLIKAINSIVDMGMTTPDFALFNADFAKYHSKKAFDKYSAAMKDSPLGLDVTDDMVQAGWALLHPEDPNVEGISRAYTNGRVPTTLTKSKILMIDTVNNVIREPSAKEYGRLQGFTDEDIDEMMKTLSNFFMNTSVDANVRDNRVYRSMNFKTGDSILVPALKVLFEQLPSECTNPNDSADVLDDERLNKIKSTMDSYKNGLDDRRNAAYKSAASGVKSIVDEYGEYEIPIQDLHAGYLNDREHPIVPEKVLKADKKAKTTKNEKPVEVSEESKAKDLEDYDWEDTLFQDVYNKANKAREEDK